MWGISSSLSRRTLLCGIGYGEVKSVHLHVSLLPVLYLEFHFRDCTEKQINENYIHILTMLLTYMLFQTVKEGFNS
jgi:hypothetical protein